MLTDEASLIAHAQRGDTQAYAALVREFEQIAFRAAFLITHDADEAADAAQEAFVRAYRALGSFKAGHPFRPWILRIVTNQALNRVQTLQRRTRATERYALTLMDQDRPSPEHTVAEHQRHETLMRAVQKLTPDEQTLISLRYFLELPENEVAQTLNIPLGTVKSRLHRTLARLREIIRREFPDLRELTTLMG